MDENELKKLIEKDESETAEFKKSTAQLDKALKAVCGFLNNKGGNIYFGIDENRKVIGQEVSDSTLKSISQKIRQRIKPEISPEIGVLDIGEKNIIEVKIKEGNNKPYYLDGIAYKRIGAENPAAAPEELERIILGKKKRYWDSDICEGAGLEDIDGEKVKRFREKYKDINATELQGSDEDMLKSLGCLTADSGQLKPTNAGILLFGKHPQDFFPHSTIRIAIYPGDDVGTEHVDIREFGGDIFSQVDEAEKYIRRYVYTPSIMKFGRIAREEMPQYPYFAIRELIVNAVVHRDYSIAGSKILIKIFNNRIKYQSPGPLPANITPKNIVKEQFLRNRAIGKAFSKIKYIEEMGEGWDRIMEEIKNHPLKPPLPIVEDTGASVIVTLFSAKLPEVGKVDEEAVNEWLTKINAKLTQELSDSEKTIISFMLKNGRINSLECQKLLGISRVMANRYFNRLIENKLMIKKGAGKFTYYVLEEI